MIESFTGSANASLMAQYGPKKSFYYCGKNHQQWTDFFKCLKGCIILPDMIGFMHVVPKLELKILPHLAQSIESEIIDRS